MPNRFSSRGFDVHAARQHLSQQDAVLGEWLERLPPIAAQESWQTPFDPVDALARAICYQQLSGKAAATIVGRVENALNSSQLTARTLSRVDDDTLRSCGVSRNKIAALRDLAHRADDGLIPDAVAMESLDNESIIKALVATRGIGRWTVEMLLIFRLGRSDVLPVDDLGVRKGVQYLDQSPELPTPKVTARRGEVWAPYRSYAAMALWRIAEAASGQTGKVRRSQE